VTVARARQQRTRSGAAKRRAPPAATAAAPRHSPSLPGADAALAQVRTICLALPEVVERPSHGAPTFFHRGKRTFVSFVDNHHHDGKLALWCAAPPGFQAMIVDAAPDRYFVPAYVGHLGWVGVRLDRGTSWDEIAAVIERAYRAVTTPGASRASAAARGR
jgi:hypothetical protein